MIKKLTKELEKIHKAAVEDLGEDQAAAVFETADLISRVSQQICTALASSPEEMLVIKRIEKAQAEFGIEFFTREIDANMSDESIVGDTLSGLKTILDELENGNSNIDDILKKLKQDFGQN